MGRNFKFSTGEYYHVYNRGTEKRKIFLDKADYHRFLSLLYLCNNSKKTHLSDYARSSLPYVMSLPKEENLVDLGAYCLMGNHYHLLLRERKKNGTSTFMQKLSTAYTMYFNKRYEHSGALFQGRFKAIHADNDRYLKYLFSYIHLNPLELYQSNWKKEGIKNKRKAEKFLNAYTYSSYLDYVNNERPEKALLAQKSFPAYFSKKKDFLEEISSWIDFTPTVKVQP